MNPMNTAQSVIRLLTPLVGLTLLLSGCQPGPPAAETGAGPAAAVPTNSTTPDTAATAAAAAPPTETAPEATNIAEGMVMLDAMTMVGTKNFLEGYDPINADGTVNAVVEIPAGTTAKWEVKNEDGNLHWDIKDGKPRLVKYLGYPVNYGMVPRTRLDIATLGGDGDPLDMLLLGDALPRGSVVPVKVIALAKFTDSGQRDDKVIVVREGTPFYVLNDLSELQASFPGVTDILATWFLNYKGPGVFESQGFGDAAEAKALLDATVDAFTRPAAPTAPAEEAAAATATP